MKVYISSEAANQIRAILDYLENNWSKKTSDDYLDKLHKAMDQIELFPSSFPKSESFPAIRKCLITRHTTAYYRIDEIRKEVEILAILDNRQDFKI